MSKTAKWVIGILVVIVILQFFAPFLWQLVFPGYPGFGGMMGRGGFGYGMHMRGMGYGMGFGGFGMLFLWLIPLGLLVLIVLGIAWLIRQLMAKTGP